MKIIKGVCKRLGSRISFYFFIYNSKTYLGFVLCYQQCQSCPNISPMSSMTSQMQSKQGSDSPRVSLMHVTMSAYPLQFMAVESMMS